MNILEANQERDLYLVDEESGRILFLPQEWADDFRDEDTDERQIYCWYGNANCLRFLNVPLKEWLTTDAQQTAEKLNKPKPPKRVIDMSYPGH